MRIKEGDTFEKASDGVHFAVKKIVNDLVVLESQDRKRQILTGVNTLKSEAYFLKTENKQL